MTVFAERVQRVKPSFTLEMTSKAEELRAQGIDVINFSAGQPDFNTPENIRNAAKAALDGGQTKYTAGSGTMRGSRRRLLYGPGEKCVAAGRDSGRNTFFFPVRAEWFPLSTLHSPLRDGHSGRRRGSLRYP